jgi:uncharacterized protein
MDMTWHDLLFMHWPVPVKALRPLIPAELTIDTFDGEARIGVVPFRMTGVTPHHFPSLPWLSAFPELNVRTYVTDGNKPGVWFFSLDAGNPVAVAVAQRFFHLPYFNAWMSLLDDGSSSILYRSHRTHRAAAEAALEVRYTPKGEVFTSTPGSLAFWLTERYCLYAQDRRRNIWRTDIEHARWPLQPAEAEVTENRMTDWLGIRLPETEPLLHFARHLKVVAGLPQRAGGRGE